MRASSLPTGTNVGAVEHPPQCQTAVTEVPGRDFRERVIASPHNNAGASAIQVGGTGEETITAIAVTISPIRDGAAGRLEIGRRPYRPGLTVEDRQELRAGEDTTGGVAEIR